LPQLEWHFKKIIVATQFQNNILNFDFTGQLFEKKTVYLERLSNCRLFWKALVQNEPRLMIREQRPVLDNVQLLIVP
jgi:hypothetical protein